MAAELAARAGAVRPVPKIMVPLAPGELVDGLTILRLKLSRITDEAKLAQVRSELDALRKAADGELPMSRSWTRWRRNRLASTPRCGTWRTRCGNARPGVSSRDEFVALARAVYHANDAGRSYLAERNALSGRQDEAGA